MSLLGEDRKASSEDVCGVLMGYRPSRSLIWPLYLDIDDIVFQDGPERFLAGLKLGFLRVVST